VATTISHWENDLRVRSCTATTASDSPGVLHTARAERHPSKRSASSRRFVGVGGAARTIRAPAAGSRGWCGSGPPHDDRPTLGL